MHRYGELADDITEMIEELEGSSLKTTSRPLVRVLEKAFHVACLLDREARDRRPVAVPQRRAA